MNQEEDATGVWLRLVGRREPMRVAVHLESGEPMAVAFGEGRPRVLEPGKPSVVWRRGVPRQDEEVA